MEDMKNKHLLTQEQQAVYDFHKMVEAYTGEWPHVPSMQTRELRISLIREELDEFIEASDSNDLVGVADALADLLYVVNGAALAWGIAMQPIFDEVHRSNMTKTETIEREDGKTVAIKGKYSQPNLEPILEAQIPRVK
jgi:predicted HAD superfamily Cof-like phosphohydrolase